MNSIEYPIFLRDRDEYVYMIDCQEDLQSLEAIDVEGQEYEAWDSKGEQLNLAMRGDAVEVSLTGIKIEIAQIRRAIAKFAELESKKSFEQPVGLTNLIDLFRAAELHIKTYRPSILKSIKKIFRRKRL